jgi:putative (di)nucleoside polyphosphate hydrolase
MDLSRHRPNVGVVLFRPDGLVFYGRRAGAERTHAWQFPQGGVDEGEDLHDAARRELAEETGVRSTHLLGRTQAWIAYDFPADMAGSKSARGWKGQKQIWFALAFDGDESEIDLAGHHPPEFDAWRWGSLDEAPDLIVPFKRDAYVEVVSAFAKYKAGTSMDSVN